MFLDWRDVTSKDVEAVLLSTKAHLSNQNLWIDYGLAFNSTNEPVGTKDPNATKFSLMGSIEKQANIIYSKPLADFVDSATREFLSEMSSYKVWKETMSYDDEISLLRMAIDEIKKYHE